MVVFLASLADIRDVVVIVYGILGALVFVASLLLVAALFLAVRALHGTVKDLVNDSVKPTLGSIRETAESIKGTTEFVGDKAVAPIIRTYGMASGVRRGLSVLTGLTKRGRG